MRGDPISVSLLGLRMLPNADPILRKHLNLRPEDRSLGFLTTDCDDVSYTALDEATMIMNSFCLVSFLGQSFSV